MKLIFLNLWKCGTRYCLLLLIIHIIVNKQNQFYADFLHILIIRGIANEKKNISLTPCSLCKERATAHIVLSVQLAYVTDRYSPRDGAVLFSPWNGGARTIGVFLRKTHFTNTQSFCGTEELWQVSGSRNHYFIHSAVLISQRLIFQLTISLNFIKYKLLGKYRQKSDEKKWDRILVPPFQTVPLSEGVFVVWSHIVMEGTYTHTHTHTHTHTVSI